MRSLSQDLVNKFSERDPEFKKVWEENALEREIASQLIDIRLDLDMTQRQFADYIGMKQSLISRLENGEQNITIATLQDILKRAGAYININISWDKPITT